MRGVRKTGEGARREAALEFRGGGPVRKRRVGRKKRPREECAY